MICLRCMRDVTGPQSGHVAGDTGIIRLSRFSLIFRQAAALIGVTREAFLPIKRDSL